MTLLPLSSPVPVASVRPEDRAAAEVTLPEPPLSLSILMNVKAGCRWSRREVESGKTHVVATFPGDCPDGGSALAWSPDRREAIFRNTAGDLQRIALDTRRVSWLPATPETAGTLETFGFDSASHPMAITIDSQRDEEGNLHWDGKVFPPGEMHHDGVAVLVHAFVLDGDVTWKHIEVKVSEDGGDYTPGIEVLNSLRDLKTGYEVSPSWGPHGEVVHDEKIVSRLNALFGTEASAEANDEDEDAWVEVMKDPAVYVYESVQEGRHCDSTSMAFARGRRIVPAPALPPHGGEDIASVEVQDGYILLSIEAHVRLYKPPSRNVVFSSDSVVNVRFWP